ncbi:ribosome biogenesis protein Nop16 [Absidia repens]|uniref:Ribosome biogenesis protein Nop16 n=1 Tax=Absidia repens TaxID=90262 RepID=A0A1X2IMY9_9FUNG|nr:ribosome biogenesis protein Nop16 [Absidia repens]
MATPRQRRTQKSGKRNTRRTADKKESYRRLGLLTNLNGKATGGVEKNYADKTDQAMDTEQDEANDEPVDLKELTEADIEQLKKTLRPDEGLIQRDDDGNIIQIITGERPSHDDILDAPIVAEEAKTDFVRGLEEQASVVRHVERHVSSSEVQWLEKLMEKHGDDELNTNQLTTSQLKKRIKNYHKTFGTN